MNEPTTAKARELQERAMNAEGVRDREREALYRPDGSKRYADLTRRVIARHRDECLARAA